MYHLFGGKTQMASMALALTCRVLFALGAHRQPSAGSDAPERQRRVEIHARKLFWLAYTFDKIVALRTSQPPCIDDEHCDLTLPAGYVEALYSSSSSSSESGNISSSGSGSSETASELRPSSTGALCCLPGDLRLSIIKSKACKLLYSARLQQESQHQQQQQHQHHHRCLDAGLLREVRELDSELEQWRLSIPARFRPMLLGRGPGCYNGGNSNSNNNNNNSNSDGDSDCWLDPAMDASQRMHVMVLYFEYQHLVASLHRAASPPPSWRAAGDATGPTAALSLCLGSSHSQTLSVEASRSCLAYFRNAAPSMMGAAFW
jgi:hypothetical protein